MKIHLKHGEDPRLVDLTGKVRHLTWLTITGKQRILNSEAAELVRSERRRLKGK